MARRTHDRPVSAGRLSGLPALPPRILILLALVALILGFAVGWLDDILLGGRYLWLTPALFLLVYGGASAVGYLLWMRSGGGHDRLSELIAMSPPELSASVARCLRNQGYRNVRRSSDGVEIVCRDRQGLIVVQVKRSARGALVGSGEVQEFAEALREHRPPPRAIFITTGRFTAPAEQLARRYDMTLIDGPKLADLVTEWDRAQNDAPLPLPPPSRKGGTG